MNVEICRAYNQQSYRAEGQVLTCSYSSSLEIFPAACATTEKASS